MKSSIISLSIFTLLSSYVSARATNERYDPYPYVALKSPISIIPASNDTSTNSTSSSTSSITIVAVDPPPSEGDVPYIANVFYANWHPSSPTSTLTPIGLTFSIEDIPWDLVGSVTYGFIPVPTKEFANITLTLDDASTIPQLVALGEQHNVTVILALGGHLQGGSSSAGFAAAFQSPENITELVTGVASLVNQTSVGGIELNWEVSSCLEGQDPYTSTEVSAAYLAFLQQLREALGADVSISLAVGPVPLATPFATNSTSLSRFNQTDPDLLQNTYSNDTSVTNTTSTELNTTLIAQPTEVTTVFGEFKNVSDYARVVDWITILNFDLNGPWSSESSLVLPNSPLNARCTSNITAAEIDLPYSISATTSVASWTLSGFRPDQIVLGVSASGRSYYVGTDIDLNNITEGVWPTFTSTANISISSVNNTYITNTTDLGDQWWWSDLLLPPRTNATANRTSTSVGTCDLSKLDQSSGVYTFRGLVNAGYLDAEGEVSDCGGDEEDGVVDPEAEVVSLWDECSETPFLYVTKTGVMVSYDDAESMELKGQFILNSGLRGFSLREVAADSDKILLTAIRKGVGFPEDLVCAAGEVLVDAPDVSDSNDDGDGDESEWDWEDTLESAW